MVVIFHVLKALCTRKALQPHHHIVQELANVGAGEGRNKERGRKRKGDCNAHLSRHPEHIWHTRQHLIEGRQSEQALISAGNLSSQGAAAPAGGCSRAKMAPPDSTSTSIHSSRSPPQAAGPGAGAPGGGGRSVWRRRAEGGDAETSTRRACGAMGCYCGRRMKEGRGKDREGGGGVEIWRERRGDRERQGEREKERGGWGCV